MNLVKENWSERDGAEFCDYLLSLKREDKIDWSRRIINTKMPLLAVATPDLRKISKEILKGNFISFLSLKLNRYYENSIVNGFLITKIKDFGLLAGFLRGYAETADNWASCDMLSFNVTEADKERWFALAKNYVKSEKPFVRRIGVNVLFRFIEADGYLQKIFSILNSFENETEYYVNMVNAWLVAECFTKKRDETLKFLQSNRLNTFTVNKAVQKCRDSFRISASDKEMLLQFKR